MTSSDGKQPAAAANPNDHLQRSALPIPDVTPAMTITYDATSPDTKFAPIVPLRPRQARRTCW